MLTHPVRTLRADTAVPDATTGIRTLLHEFACGLQRIRINRISPRLNIYRNKQVRIALDIHMGPDVFIEQSISPVVQTLRH